jgi:hypothetical protein
MRPGEPTQHLHLVDGRQRGAANPLKLDQVPAAGGDLAISGPGLTSDPGLLFSIIDYPRPT